VLVSMTITSRFKKDMISCSYLTWLMTCNFLYVDLLEVSIQWKGFTTFIVSSDLVVMGYSWSRNSIFDDSTSVFEMWQTPIKSVKDKSRCVTLGPVFILFVTKIYAQFFFRENIWTFWDYIYWLNITPN
jgi:hypothetical protein